LTLTSRHRQRTELGDQIADLSATVTDEVVMSRLDIGVEAAGARTELQHGDLTHIRQVVEGLVDGLERDCGHLGTGRLVDSLGARVRVVSVQDTEDALALGRNLEAPGPEHRCQLVWRPHREHPNTHELVINNGCRLSSPRRRPVPRPLVGAGLTLVPGIAIRLAGSGLAPLARSALYGAAIVGASLLLAWAAEAAQLDLAPALAIGGLALVAVLPEYVVGNVFAWRGGQAVARFGPACQSSAARLAGHDSGCTLALANMLGANRLLIGIGWSLVVLVAWWRRRQRGERTRGVVLGREHSVELAFLALACGWCLTLPLRRSITLVDCVVLLAVFVGYGWRVAKAPPEEPELEGVAEWIGGAATPARRRLLVVAFMGVAAFTIFVCASAFADALVASGSVLGIDEFFLIQWLAPLASEAPELVISVIFAWRLRAAVGLGALVSSKINQWTVLVGSLPITFAIAAGATHGLPLGATQRQELALTAAQSVFGVGVLGNLEVSTLEAAVVFAMFVGEFLGVALVAAPNRAAVRLSFALAYLVLGVGILVVKRRDTAALVRDGFRTPYAELGGSR